MIVYWPFSIVTEDFKIVGRYHAVQVVSNVMAKSGGLNDFNYNITIQYVLILTPHYQNIITHMRKFYTYFSLRYQGQFH